MKWKLTSENLESQKREVTAMRETEPLRICDKWNWFLKVEFNKKPNHVVFSWVLLVAWASSSYVPKTCHFCPCTRRGGWKKRSRSWWSSEQPGKVAEGSDSQRSPALSGQTLDILPQSVGASGAMKPFQSSIYALGVIAGLQARANYKDSGKPLTFCWNH